MTKEADHLDVLLDHVPPSGTGQLLVTLHEVTAGTRTTWQGVEVRLDGERIGELTKATSAKFLAAVQHYDAIGLTTVARATIKGSSLSAEVTLQAAKAHELTDADLEPEISPLPRLVPFQQDAIAYPVPDAYIPTAGERVKTIAKRKIREIITAQEPPSATPDHEPAPSPVNEAPDPTPAPSTTTRPANPFAAPRVTQPPSPVPAPAAAAAATQPAAASFADKAVSLLEDVHATRPGLISTVLLWIGAVFGVLCVLVGVSSTGASVSYGLGMLLLGAGISLACGWPLSRRRTDQKAIVAWEADNRRSAELNSLLTPEDAVIAAGLTRAPRPEKVPRQWKKVGTVAFILAVIGLACVGAGADEYAESTGTGTGSSAVSH